MPTPSAKFVRHAVRSLLPAAAVALGPKCFLCVAAYLGLGAALGLGGQEICGAYAPSSITWVLSLAWLGFVGGLITLGILARHGR